VGQKSKHANLCNNFVYGQPIFIIFGHGLEILASFSITAYSDLMILLNVVNKNLNTPSDILARRCTRCEA